MLSRNERLQAVLDSLVGDGAVGALMRYRDVDGEWCGASGVHELGSRNPVDPAAFFRIGSVTKSFTATVVLQLSGAGLLGLDDSVERWLPGIVPSGDRITLRQLLNHTSGLYNYTDDFADPADLMRDRFEHRNPRDTVRRATGHAPLFEPGSAWSYSNTNYILLGLLIEAVTGGSYASEIENRILRPLNLRQTLLPGDNVTLPEPHVRGYLPLNGELVDLTEWNPSSAWSAGEMISTTADLNRFYAALLAGELVDPADIREMQTAVPADASFHEYGLGISRIRLPNLVLWGHFGGFFGYRTWSYHSSDASQQVTLSLTSAHGQPPGTDDLLERIFCRKTVC